MKRGLILIALFLLWGTGCYLSKADTGKTEVVVITDLYHPYQDPGDNLDLIMGFGLPDVELKAVLLDITDAFRKQVADHPTLWQDPRGPREAGFIPVRQLNYIFDRSVPCAMGPMSMMKSEYDKMEYVSHVENGAIDLLFEVLKSGKNKVDILSFGSARILAVAFNRNPELMKRKIRKIHLSAGTASPNYELGQDQGANAIPGGEWNVALDVCAFTRILKSQLPVAIYPCAGKDGGFVKDHNNTYWQLPSMAFVKEMHPQLQRYLDFAFLKKLQFDYLRAMNMDSEAPDIDTALYPSPFHVWESAIWLNATHRKIICSESGRYRLIQSDDMPPKCREVGNGLRYCILEEIRDDGRFKFSYTDKDKSNIQIYYRDDVDENERAMQEVIPQLYISIRPNP